MLYLGATIALLPAAAPGEVLTTAPLFTMASMWLLDALGWELLPPEGLNPWSVGGACAVVAGSMTCALAARTGRY